MSERTVMLHSEITYFVEAAPAVILLQVAAMHSDQQFITDELLTVNPSATIDQLQIGPLGGRACRLHLQQGLNTIHYSATATLTHRLPNSAELHENDYMALPADVLPYLNPSRYCESDKLWNFANATFGHMDRSYNRVSNIADWIYNNLSYTPASTAGSTTACDVLVRREGVCRDFAHVGIALCRALDIPARYVSGYAVNLQPPDFHGLFEAFLGREWVLFDSTRLASVSGFVRIASGLDAADLAFATLIGRGQLTDISVQATDR